MTNLILNLFYNSYGTTISFRHKKSPKLAFWAY
jgi:hypothetical protein